ncbi:MAG: SpoIIE family protein phosphatase [Acidimicrobiales bacterium]|nr:SpoIIE family protein phosphatase [Acidimicrobiales bacterium]HRW38041.1 SpoIIE family protein phosphatase [Aquihabitans sp.]
MDSERRFRDVLDAMQDHVAIGASVRDRHGAIVDFSLTFLNRAFVDGAGRAGEELLGGRVLELFPGWADHGLLDAFRQVVETREPLVAERVRYEGTTADGRPIVGWWSLTVVPFDDGYLASSRDITAQVQAEEERRRAELDAVRHREVVELLQRAALPQAMPSVAGVELGARYQPAAAQPIGGDWYDAFALDERRVGLVIADVAGHGPEAAAFMVQVRNVVRALAHEHEAPGRVLARADAVLARLTTGDLFATCCYAVLDVGTSRVTWARAGHLHPILWSATPEVLEADGGPPLGVDGAGRFPVASCDLAPGDGLVLFTDGLVETRDRSLAEGVASLVDQVGRAAASVSAQALADGLAAAVGEPEDDLAVLVARRTGAPRSARS